MNKQRRKQLVTLINDIESIQLRLAEITEEETQSYENRPDSFKDSEQGELSYEGIEYLELSSEHIDQIIENISEAIGI